MARALKITKHTGNGTAQMQMKRTSTPRMQKTATPLKRKVD